MQNDEYDVNNDSEEDDESEILKKALPCVKRKLPYTNDPPATAEEYLNRVVYEASQCPAVVTADISRLKIKPDVSTPGNADSSLSCFPSNSEWRVHQVASFSAVRQAVTKARLSPSFIRTALPGRGAESKWRSLCLSEKPPLLTILLSMTERTLGRVLEYHVTWMQRGLQSNQGPWLYAILACLDLPLTPDDCSTVRLLARQCANLCHTSQPCISNEDRVVMSLIMCLVVNYFGQSDLNL